MLASPGPLLGHVTANERRACTRLQGIEDLSVSDFRWIHCVLDDRAESLAASAPTGSKAPGY